MRTLRIAAAVEAVSLAILLVNLATVHAEVITSLGGPVHGTSYLAVIAAAWLAPAAPAARWRALVPGVGGLLVLRKTRPSPPDPPPGTE
ncbi:hypothetical protein [Actinomadura viridis]|uniref:Uncharacterized protein YaaW (UPF0174 family) n=1 Tax=Actinomadura viridis TaxID=58110 RepID=A0A931GM43_9ACTN|nr:hypothetical protein [Actinomadura viridis]MBG6092778.1 uncharacterized protein YaaW (UPF0174 family) [Actinomadura viridis]